jgi:hypothetical protein
MVARITQPSSFSGTGTVYSSGAATGSSYFDAARQNSAQGISMMIAGVSE